MCVLYNKGEIIIAIALVATEYASGIWLQLKNSLRKFEMGMPTQKE